MTRKRSPLMQKRIADNREQIVQAARTLIARGGFRAASIAAVAKEVGLSTGAIYRYFPAKADLFVELLAEAVSKEIALLQSSIDQPGPAALRLGAAVESFATRALKGPHLAYAFIAEPTDPEVEAARIRGKRQFCAIFEAVLREGIKRGELPRQRVAVTAACIVGAFTEALVGPIGPRGPGNDKADDKDLVREIVHVCMRAAGHPAAAAKRERA